MKNIRSNIIAAGILCLSLGMTSCTKASWMWNQRPNLRQEIFIKQSKMPIVPCWAATMVIDVQHVVALSISWLAPK